MRGPFPRDAKPFSLGFFYGGFLKLSHLALPDQLHKTSYKAGFLPVRYRNLKADCFSPKVTIAKFWQGQIQ